MTEPCKPFWGRTRELERIRAWDEHRSRLCVVYGRRRVGKTRLVDEACHPWRVLKVEGLEGLDPQSQRRVFLKSMAEFFAAPEMLTSRLPDWLTLFTMLSERLRRQPVVVFLDEFQWLAGERRELVSHLKHAWDNLFTKRNCIQLVLCGSVSSFMVKRVLQSKALYGRVAEEIHLRPLSLPECVRDLTQRRSLSEVVELFMLVGGVPQYLEMFDLTRSLRVNLEDLFFRPNGYFVNEYDRLFASHFGRNRHYAEILAHLGRKRWADQQAIRSVCHLGEGGRTSEYLEDLEGAGFIERYRSVDRAGGVRNTRYRIGDPYLDFYFRFIAPNRSPIHAGTDRAPLTRYLPDREYYPWRGLAFERFCLQHHQTIADRLGFGGIAYDAGSWFSRKAGLASFQIDLVFLRADRVMTICEMKFLDRPVGKDVVEPFARRIEKVRNPKSHTIERVLVTATPPTPPLEHEGYFNRILTIADLFA